MIADHDCPELERQARPHAANLDGLVVRDDAQQSLRWLDQLIGVRELDPLCEIGRLHYFPRMAPRYCDARKLPRVPLQSRDHSGDRRYLFGGSSKLFETVAQLDEQLIVVSQAEAVAEQPAFAHRLVLTIESAAAIHDV